MACSNKELAEKLILYQELTPDERVVVDEHVAQCSTCAEDLEVIKQIGARFSLLGQRKREGLVHPPEEAIIQYAVDARLLLPAQASQVKKHLQEDKCFTCKRVYWSIRDAETEAASQPWTRTGEESLLVKFWRKYVFSSTSPILAASLAVLVIGLSGTLIRIRGLKQLVLQKQIQVAELQAEQVTLKQGYEQQRRQLEEQSRNLEAKVERLSQPSVGFSSGIRLGSRRGKQETVRISFPKDADVFNLTIELKEGYRRFIVELFEDTGVLIWQKEIETDRSTLQLSMRKTFLKRNKLALKVSGKTRQGKVEPISEIPLEFSLNP